MRTLVIAAVFCAVPPCGVAFLPARMVGQTSGEETKPAEASASSALNGLVGYWPFDEGQGDTAANVMGLNGSLFVAGKVGAAVMGNTTWAEGKFGKAARFERKGAGIAVGYMEALDCDTAVSVAAWIRWDGAYDEGLIWNYERAYRLALVKGSNRARFMMNLDGKWAGNMLLSKTALERNRWYHIAGVYDGKERRLYIDGQLNASEPKTGTISRGGRITIGQGFTGLVDEVKVWNRALSANELKQAMRADRGRVQSLLRPEHALCFYPVKCVGLLGRPEPVELAVFNSAQRPFQGEVSFSVVSANGARLCAKTLALSLPGRGRTQVKLAYRPEEAGRHALTARVGDQELFRTTVYVLAPRPRPTTGDLKLNKVVSVDLTQDLGSEAFCDDGASRVVVSPLGRYREAGPGMHSRFVVRAALKRPGPHLLRIKYPDDKPRVCEITACSPAGNDVFNAQTGYFTGSPYPLSMRFQTVECLLWARHADQWIRFCTWAQDCPAAAVSVEVFEIEGGLPASPASLPPARRQIGHYWEDALPLARCFGSDARSPEAFDRAMCNLCDYLSCSGQNAMIHPAVWYNGPIYNSLVEPRGIGRGADGGADFPRVMWLDILLHRFEERGLKFYAALNVHDLPSLLSAATADIEKIKAGAPTFNAVTKDNQVSRETWHHRPPVFNALHPRVKGQVLALVDELATRHGKSPAFGGIVFHLTKCQLLQLGGLEVGYDDWTISEFARDTGTKLPVVANNPKRFRQRYDWLMANARDRWMQWRCEKIADYYGEAARVLRRHRPDLQLVLSMWVPAVVIPEVRKRWEQGERLVVQTREEGVDPALLGQIPGVAIQKFLSATDYRWRLALAGLKSEKTLLPIRTADFCADQLRDYRTTSQFGVYIHNRYFENGSMRKAIDSKPVKSSWYKEPPWLASAVVPGHDHFMEYYAQAMAVFDPSLITIGGFTVGTVGHERQVEQFARVFRLLPTGKWEPIPGLGDRVAGRTLRVNGKHYLYLVNRSATEARVAISLTVAPGTMQALGSSPKLTSTGKGYQATLEPYQLAAWVSE